MVMNFIFGGSQAKPIGGQKQNKGSLNFSNRTFTKARKVVFSGGEKFKKGVSKKKWSKIFKDKIGQVKFTARGKNREQITINQTRDYIIATLRKAGTKGISGERLKRKLEKDLNIKIEDAKKIITAAAIAAADKYLRENTGLSEKQKKIFVKQSQEIARLMEGRTKTVRNLRQKRDKGNIKKKFEETTYKRLQGVGDIKYKIGEQELSTGDARSSPAPAAKSGAASIHENKQAGTAAVASIGEKLGKDKATSIAAGTGVKQVEKTIIVDNRQRFKNNVNTISPVSFKGDAIISSKLSKPPQDIKKIKGSFAPEKANQKNVKSELMEFLRSKYGENGSETKTGNY